MLHDSAAAHRRSASRAVADDLRTLARAMIRQAQMLKTAGSPDVARELAGRAVALNHLGWSYVEAA